MTYLLICLLVVVMGGCTFTKQYNDTDFYRFCDERVAGHADFVEQYKIAVQTKNEREINEMFYVMGLYHGCIHGVMDWEWFREKPPKYGSGK